MGDFGIKISDSGNSVFTAGLDDTTFTSQNSSLMLIDTQTIEYTALEGETYPDGTETYEHNFGYAPLIIAYVQNYGGGKFLPVPYFATTTPFPGTYVDSSVSMYIKENSVDINWAVNEYVPGESLPLSGDLSFKVTLSIYGYKLGSTT